MKSGTTGKEATAGKGTAGGKEKLTVTSDTKGKWMASLSTSTQPHHLTEQDYLPEQVVVAWRSPVMANKAGVFTEMT